MIDFKISEEYLKSFSCIEDSFRNNSLYMIVLNRDITDQDFENIDTVLWDLIRKAKGIKC